MLVVFVVFVCGGRRKEEETEIEGVFINDRKYEEKNSQKNHDLLEAYVS